MFSRLLFVFTCIIFFFFLIQVPFAQEPAEERGYVFEEEIDEVFKTELQDKEVRPQFITVDILTPKVVEPAINFYIRDDPFTSSFR
jgi:hypothetical protein